MQKSVVNKQLITVTLSVYRALVHVQLVRQLHLTHINVNIEVFLILSINIPYKAVHYYLCSGSLPIVKLYHGFLDGPSYEVL